MLSCQLSRNNYASEQNTFVISINPTPQKRAIEKLNQPQKIRKANRGRSNLVTVPDLVRRKNHVQVVNRHGQERLSNTILNFSFSVKTPNLSLDPHEYHNGVQVLTGNHKFSLFIEKLVFSNKIWIPNIVRPIRFFKNTSFSSSGQTAAVLVATHKASRINLFQGFTLKIHVTTWNPIFQAVQNLSVWALSQKPSLLVVVPLTTCKIISNKNDLNSSK